METTWRLTGKNAAPVLALSFGLLVIGYFFAHHYVFAHDDAFITYEYAANLARGNGLVFNTGERVWGFTSPLQTLLLGLAATVGLDVPATAFCLAILWIALTAWILFRVCLHFFPGVGAALLAALFLLTWGESYGYLGLETNLLIMLESLFLLLMMEGKQRWAALVASLCCLARPDALLFVVPVMALAKESRKPANLGLFVLPGLLWSVFALGYYGSLLPNTFYAKTGADPFWQHLQESFKMLTASRSPSGSVDPWLLLSLGLCPLINANVRGAAAAWYALLVYPWVLLIAYALIGAPLEHTWETFSAYFFFRLGALVGFFSLLQALLDRIGAASSRRRFAGIGLRAGVAAAVLAVAGFNGWEGFRKLDRMQTEYWLGGRHRDYLAISRWINGNVPRGATLGLLEVGTIGYYTDVKILDVCGLITKGVKATTPIDFAGFMRRFEPEYMLLPDLLAAPIVLGPSLRYQPVKFFPRQYYGNFTMFRRSG